MTSSQSNNITGISLHYLSENEALRVEYNNLHVNITCDADMGDALTFDGRVENTLLFTSARGCPVFKYDALAMFITRYSFLLGGVLILAGLFLAFFGNKFLNFVIGLVGFIASTVLLLMGSFMIIEKSN
jgi:hypothetical protein